ncbi:MAG: S24 family peptidase [Bacillota bacterium]|nr:S24 family peptidase [Bacillota bacterium]
MTYAEMLQKIIGESQLSLRQIARRCESQNLAITPSYISQLKNGKLPPPSEEVSLVLAKVCGVKEPAYLVFQGYMEKAPGLVREYMLAASTLNKTLLDSLCQMKEGSVPQEVRDYINNMDALTAMEMSSKYIDGEGKLKAESLVREIALTSGVITEADTRGELLNFFLGDTSMAPTIPSHSLIYVLPTRTDLLKDRDIIAFYPDNRRTPTLRRFFCIKGKYVLVPDERSHQVYFFERLEEINYAGKVISYRVDL